MKTVFFRSRIRYSFRHYIEYVLSKAEKSIIVDSNGISITSAEMSYICMNLQAGLNKKTKYPEVHMAIVLSNEEANKDCKELVRCYLREMGWDKLQYLAVRHYDVPNNPHCHIVLNLINEMGKRISDSFCIQKSNIICRNLSRNNKSDSHLEERIDTALKDSYNMRELRWNLNMEFMDMKKENEEMEFFEINNPKNNVRYPTDEILRRLEIGLIGNLDITERAGNRKNLNSHRLH